MYQFWKGKKILITGHSGFKGSWLSLWLQYLGADVYGYALKPNTVPSLFELADIASGMTSVYGDIRDINSFSSFINLVKPEFIFHLAAQPLVRDSYIDPVDTYTTNVMGLLNLFEICKNSNFTKVIINVTTDKCYKNNEGVWPYRESDPLGGIDPYSASKACSEIISASYQESFFYKKDIVMATARAGNVIGGGDWSKDRVMTDIVTSLLSNTTLNIRNPSALRPWQHVLEPLGGYLLLAKKIYEEGEVYAGAWNFGPVQNDCVSVEDLLEGFKKTKFGKNLKWAVDTLDHPHESQKLQLDCSKAKFFLGWQSKWSLEYSLEKISDWYLTYQNNESVRDLTVKQIKEYMT